MSKTLRVLATVVLLAVIAWRMDWHKSSRPLPTYT